MTTITELIKTKYLELVEWYDNNTDARKYMITEAHNSGRTIEDYILLGVEFTETDIRKEDNDVKNLEEWISKKYIKTNRDIEFPNKLTKYQVTKSGVRYFKKVTGFCTSN